MDVIKILVSSYKNRASCLSVYDNVTAESGPTSGGAIDDTDMTSSCSEDVTGAVLALTNNSKPLPVIQIPTERSKEANDTDVASSCSEDVTAAIAFTNSNKPLPDIQIQTDRSRDPEETDVTSACSEDVAVAALTNNSTELPPVIQIQTERNTDLNDTDVTSACSDDVTAALALTDSTEPLPDIEISTELSKEPDSKHPEQNSGGVVTPDITADDQDDKSASQQLLRRKSADADDDGSNAMVRVQLPGTCECGLEFTATVTAPVADLVSECLDFGDFTQVDAVPVDPQFYNQWARHPRADDPDGDVTSGTRRPTSLRMLPATGSLKSYTLMNAIVRDQQGPLERYAGGNFFHTFRSGIPLLGVPGAAGDAGNGNPLTARRVQVPGPPPHEASTTRGGGCIRSAPTSWRRSSSSSSSNNNNGGGRGGGGGGGGRRGETLLPPLPAADLIAAETAALQGDDREADFAGSDLLSPANSRHNHDHSSGRICPACPGSADGRGLDLGCGTVGTAAESKVVVDLTAGPVPPKRWRSSPGAENRSSVMSSSSASSSSSSSSSSAAAAAAAAAAAERQQQSLTMNMASLLFSQEVDMREQRYRQYVQTRARLAAKNRQYLHQPDADVLGAAGTRTLHSGRGRGGSREHKDGGRARSGGPAAPGADVTSTVQFIDLTEVKQILIKDRKSARNVERKTIVAGLASPEMGSTSAGVSGRSGMVAMASSAAYRHFGGKPAVSKVYKGSFLTVGVPIPISATKTSAE